MSTGTLKQYNTFVKGIVTEAGPLTFPEDASIDEENCVLNRDGSRQRRLGMDVEQDFALHPVTLEADDATATIRWYNAANDPDNQFVVVQTGTWLHIFDASAPSISNAPLSSIDMTSTLTGKVALQGDSIEGFLVLASGTGAMFYLSYNPGTGVFATTALTLRIRDFLGVDDGLAVDNNPGSLSDEHEYNLLNQGWTSARITTWQSSESNYPANNQQWFLGKDTEGAFDPDTLAEVDFGTTPAPKGRFIIDAFTRSASRQTASGVAGLPTDTETGRPSTVCSAFQRVFYAGVPSSVTVPDTNRPNMTGWIFYSRVVRSAKDLSQAYSDADPTSEVDSDLVETDGGYLIIPNSGRIYRIVPMGNAVVVFAEKGVWSITGGERGFTAVEHQVMKVTDFGVQSASTIVPTEESTVYWNRGGIYALQPDSVSGFLSASNISESTIQTLYNTIGMAAKRTAQGSFDPINRRISWLYNDEEDYDPNTYGRRYNKELVMDLVLGAFYKNSISIHEDPSPYVAGYVETPEFLLRQEGIRTRGESVTKYLVVQFLDPDNDLAAISFGYYRDPSFRDWKSIDGTGVSFQSWLLTGDEIMGDTARQKRVPYLFVHMKQTERNAIEDPNTGQAVADNPSGLLVQARWDWSDHPDSGKWQEAFQAYKLLRPILLEIGQPINYGQEVVTTKSRLTGSGKGLRLYMTSDGDKDFYLYGWAARYAGNQNV